MQLTREPLGEIGGHAQAPGRHAFDTTWAAQASTWWR
jgi:hypothetical protein